MHGPKANKGKEKMDEDDNGEKWGGKRRRRWSGLHGSLTSRSMASDSSDSGGSNGPDDYCVVARRSIRERVYGDIGPSNWRRRGNDMQVDDRELMRSDGRFITVEMGWRMDK